jgi:glycine dehydrogenase subunit 1
LPRQLRQRGFLAALPLGRWFPHLADCFSLAVTEKRTRAEIDALVAALAECRP